MRVAVLAHVFPRSLDDSMGAFLLHLADALAQVGIAIEVVAPHAPNLADEETIGTAKVHRFHYAPSRWERLAYTGAMHESVLARGIGSKLLFGLFSLAFLLHAAWIVRASGARLIHAHWWFPGGFIGALASMLTRKPLLITTHGTDVEMLRRTPWAIPLARFASARAYAITCGSDYLRGQLVDLGVVDPFRASVIPMPISPLFSRLDKSSIGPSPRQSSLVLTVARLTHQKSIDTLIAAMADLRDRKIDAQLRIIGDGPERVSLEEQVRSRGLQDRIRFLGALAQSELGRHYEECAVFVLPSIREGLGLVLAEALLCGAPVIAANSGGVTDIVQDGETGLLFPERDALLLADAIERILNDRVLAGRLASAGAERVRARFTVERAAEQFASIYQRALVAGARAG